MTVEQALNIVRHDLVYRLIEQATAIGKGEEPIGDFFETDEGFIDLTVRVSIGDEPQVIEKYGQEIYDLLVSDW
jgi:hypothetical protein